MKRIRLVVPLLVLVALTGFGCQKTPPETTVYTIKAGFSVALAGMNTYAKLPFCTVVPKPNPCAEPKAVVEVALHAQAADLAIQAAEDIVRNHPTWDAAATIAAAEQAVATAKLIAVNYGIKVEATP